MQPAQPFGRRGVVAAPQPQFQPAGRQPTVRDAAPRKTSTRETPGLDAIGWEAPARPAGMAGSDRGIMWILFGFDGRLSPANYRLIRVVLNICAIILFWSLGRFVAQPHTPSDLGPLLFVLLLELAALPVWIWMTVAMQIKRWHDRDKSGVWMLVGFIPVIGPLWTLVELMFLEGTMGPNRFGPSPKGDPSAVFD